MRLRVATWNVHRCVGLDRAQDVDRVAVVLNELDADVIALQEVESGDEDEGALRQLAQLSQATGLVGIPGPTLFEAKGHYGNAVLTRHRVGSRHEIDLSVSGREPRGALVVEVSASAVNVRVVTTHFGLRAVERRIQVERLLAGLPGNGAPLVVCGDFNEWLPRSHVLRRLIARFGPAPSPRTFPSDRPLFALDRIWATPPSVVEQLERHCTPLARVASDHLPVRATVRVEGMQHPS